NYGTMVFRVAAVPPGGVVDEHVPVRDGQKEKGLSWFALICVVVEGWARETSGQTKKERLGDAPPYYGSFSTRVSPATHHLRQWDRRSVYATTNVVELSIVIHRQLTTTQSLLHNPSQEIDSDEQTNFNVQVV
ncbi:10212_t:CDS:2, partial [Acaulospora colombiana]